MTPIRRRSCLAAGLVPPWMLGAPRARAAPLPAQQLRVQTRWVVVSRPARPGRDAEGARVTSTGDARGALAGGVVAAPLSGEVYEVLVLNGEQALQMARLQAVPRDEVGWDARHGPMWRADSEWVQHGLDMLVRPSWPGGDAPVRMVIDGSHAGPVPAAGAQPQDGAAAIRSSFSTTTMLLLDTWFLVAASATRRHERAPGAGEARRVLDSRDAVADRLTGWQVRVSLA